MSDLGEFFGLQQRVDELERRLAYEIECRAEDKAKFTKRMRADVVAKSRYKRKWEKLKAKHEVAPVTKCDIARGLITQKQAGELDITLATIAKRVRLSYSTVRNLARHLQQGGRTYK